jgi:hypothetical protein
LDNQDLIGLRRETPQPVSDLRLRSRRFPQRCACWHSSRSASNSAWFITFSTPYAGFEGSCERCAESLCAMLLAAASQYHPRPTSLNFSFDLPSKQYSRPTMDGNSSIAMSPKGQPSAFSLSPPGGSTLSGFEPQLLINRLSVMIGLLGANLVTLHLSEARARQRNGATCRWAAVG